MSNENINCAKTYKKAELKRLILLCETTAGRRASDLSYISPTEVAIHYHKNPSDI